MSAATKPIRRLSKTESKKYPKPDFPLPEEYIQHSIDKIIKVVIIISLIIYLNLPTQCECSSGVEHHLAKVRVVGPNPITRSKSPSIYTARVVELVDTLDLKSNEQ